MVDVLLLELEGVIVDVREARRASLAEALASLGIAVEGDGWAEPSLGQTTVEQVSWIATFHGAPLDATAAELLALRADRVFAERVGKGVMLHDGAAAFLEGAAASTRLALVTRMRRAEVEFVLGLGGLAHLFEVIVTSDDVLDPKPAPQGYQRALARLTTRRPLERERCLALEDAPPGIRAARAARLRCLAVGEISAVGAIDAYADGWIPSLVGQTVAALEALATRPEKEPGL